LSFYLPHYLLSATRAKRIKDPTSLVYPSLSPSISPIFSVVFNGTLNPTHPGQKATSEPSYSPSLSFQNPISSRKQSLSPSGQTSKLPWTHVSKSPSLSPSSWTTNSIEKFNPSQNPTFSSNSSIKPTLTIPTTDLSFQPSHFEIQSPTSGTHPSLLPTPEPSNEYLCDLSYTKWSSMIIDVVTKISAPASLINSSTPQFKALDWLLNEDKADLCPNDAKLVQRYVLAVMYYSTGGDNWFKCSASPNATDSCGMEQPFVDQTRFLNATGNECTWAGIRCSESQCVTQIEFGKYMGNNQF
jgi:hypothetical protein